jgi:primosomal protein N''
MHYYMSITKLRARLPEIAWRLRGVDSLRRHLPIGLFACATPHQTGGVEPYIDEINSNLDALERDPHGHRAHFLAQQINTKIEVLLRLSQLPVATTSSVPGARLGLNSLATRQHWLAQLHTEIARLTSQHMALNNALSAKLAQGLRDDSVAVLQREMGELNRCLTQAQEALAAATGSQWRNYRLA